MTALNVVRLSIKPDTASPPPSYTRKSAQGVKETSWENPQRVLRTICEIGQCLFLTIFLKEIIINELKLVIYQARHRSVLHYCILVDFGAHWYNDYLELLTRSSRDCSGYPTSKTQLVHYLNTMYRIQKKAQYYINRFPVLLSMKQSKAKTFDNAQKKIYEKEKVSIIICTMLVLDFNI